MLGVVLEVVALHRPPAVVDILNQQPVDRDGAGNSQGEPAGRIAIGDILGVAAGIERPHVDIGGGPVSLANFAHHQQAMNGGGGGLSRNPQERQCTQKRQQCETADPS